MNKSSILIHKGKKWLSSSVISDLKREHERAIMVSEIRDQHYPSKISKMELKYYTFD